MKRQGRLCPDDGRSGRPQFEDQGTVRGLYAARTGGMNNKLHAICNSKGWPLNLFVTASQLSNDIGAQTLLSNLPDTDCFREALKSQEICACILGRKQWKKTVEHNERR